VSKWWRYLRDPGVWVLIVADAAAHIASEETGSIRVAPLRSEWRVFRLKVPCRCVQALGGKPSRLDLTGGILVRRPDCYQAIPREGGEDRPRASLELVPQTCGEGH